MRIFLLDVSRGVSLVAMLGYHFFWDLGYFGFIDIRLVTKGVGLTLAQLIGTSFIIISGMSARLLTSSQNFGPKFRKRIVKLLIISAIISIVTFIVDQDNFIFFGILHFLSICSLISLILVNIEKNYLVFLMFMGTAVVSLSSITFDLPLIVSWIGLNKNPPITNDFYPLFPWITFYLFGFWSGYSIMKKRNGGSKIISILNPKRNRLFNFLGYIGQKSLIIYILHQPILFSLFFLFIRISS